MKHFRQILKLCDSSTIHNGSEPLFCFLEEGSWKHDQKIKKYISSWIEKLNEKNYKTIVTAFTPPKWGPPICIVLG